MFFLARSIACIGLVAFLAPPLHGADDWRSIAESAQNAAADHVDALCAVAPAPCAQARMAQRLVSGPVDVHDLFAARKSVDTLRRMDLMPAWTGPSPKL